MVLEFQWQRFRGAEQNYIRVRCVDPKNAEIEANCIPAQGKAAAFDWREATAEELALAPKEIL